MQFDEEGESAATAGLPLASAQFLARVVRSAQGFHRSA
jgi:hypothetical protein